MFKKLLAVVAMLFFTAMAMAAVDVNKASEAELDSVKGIGPGTSKLILEERKKGEFKSWDDLISRVKGVGETRAKNLSEAGLTVGGKAYTATSTTRKDDKSAAKADEKAAKTEAKADKKDAKAEAKAEKKEVKADAKASKAQAEAKKEKQEARAEKKEETAGSRAAAADAKK